MYVILGRPKTISDLNGHFTESIGALRTKTNICIIDDEVFPKIKTLNNHDYKLKELGDISDINATAIYQIVLCDIKGVGKKFGSIYEGGHIIEEIHKYFPSKVIIAYTGERLDPTFNRFFSIADRYIKKDASDDEWIQYLDEAISLVHSPIDQWKKTRNRLLELSINSIDLIKVEDLYVRSYLEKSNLFINSNLLKRISPDIKAILLNLAASVIFSAATGIIK